MAITKKSRIVFLIIVLLTLPIALYLISQSQENRKQAADCTISLDTSDAAIHPANTFQQPTPGYYKLLISNGKKFKINWTCPVNINHFKVKSDSTGGYITENCKVNLSSSFCPAGVAPADAECEVVPAAKSGTITCQNLGSDLYNVQLEFYPSQ